MKTRIALLLPLLWCLAGPPVAGAAGRPNIVVVLVDDVGFSDIGCYGGEVPTPNLDRLAAGGVGFTQFYNAARCSPSRAALLTGLYPHQAGMGWLDNMVEPKSRGLHGRLLPRCVTIAEVLRDAGYFTAMTGKWHLGQQNGTPPWERGFMRSLNSRYGEVYFPREADRPGTENLYLDGKEIPKNSPVFGADWYSTDLFTDWGLKFVDEARAAGKPFFLYIAQGAAHFPLRAPREVIDKYRGRYAEGWDVLRERRRAKQVQLGLIDERWALAPRPPESPAWETRAADRKARFEEIMAVYAAMIDRIGVAEDGVDAVARVEAPGQLQKWRDAARGVDEVPGDGHQIGHGQRPHQAPDQALPPPHLRRVQVRDLADRVAVEGGRQAGRAHLQPHDPNRIRLDRDRVDERAQRARPGDDPSPPRASAHAVPPVAPGFRAMQTTVTPKGSVPRRTIRVSQSQSDSRAALTRSDTGTRSAFFSPPARRFGRRLARKR